MKQLTEETLLQCPLCKEDATALQWDVYTQSKCYTRELKRAYKSIFTKGIMNKNKDYHYCCPYCDKYSKASTLKHITLNLDNLEDLLEDSYTEEV